MHVLSLTAFLVLSQTTEPAAMVLTTKGSVSFQRGKDAAQRLGAMTLLAAADRLQLPEGSEVLAVFLVDGHRERVKGKAAATVAAKGFEPADHAERVAGPKLTPASLDSLRELARSSRGGVGVLRSDERSGKTPVVTPMYGATVVTDRPDFSWPATKDAEAYEVLLLSGVEGRDQRKLWQAKVKSTKLAYPEKEKPLAAGLRYHWKIYPVKGDERGEPIISSKFFVLTKSERQILEGAKHLQDSKSAEDLLLAATLYEAHGVYEEALKLYERLAEMSPGEAGFQNALASYYERAGRKDMAELARKRAKSLAGGD